MSKWTPGKWSVHQIRNKYHVRGNEDGQFGESKFNILLLNEADARLIAEAPAMAAMLERLSVIIHNCEVAGVALSDEDDEAWGEATALLARLEADK